jgi:hypothetical protein
MISADTTIAGSICLNAGSFDTPRESAGVTLPPVCVCQGPEA